VKAPTGSGRNGSLINQSDRGMEQQNQTLENTPSKYSQGRDFMSS